MKPSNPRGDWRNGCKDWCEVSQTSPCPICQKPDWCSQSKDGGWIACRREACGSVKAKTDKNGAELFLHRLGLPTSFDPAPSGTRTKPHSPDSNSLPRADATTLDRAHVAILQGLSLSTPHRDALQRRGLADEVIASCAYRSLLAHGRALLAKMLKESLGPDFASIPGLVETGVGPRILGPQGLLIPCRDVEGRIVALKVRRDGATTSNKYVYLSSRRHAGPGPGAPVHVPLGIQAPIDVIRITEGELKADIATALSGLPTISVPGVANWRPSLDVLKTLQPKTIRLAFDADASTNRLVAKALLDFANCLQSEGFTIELERWDPALGKGIDDVLAAALEPEVLVGDSVHATIEEYVRCAGIVARPEASSEIAVKLRTVLDAGGPTALFRDQNLLRDLARVMATEPAESAILRDQLRGEGIKTRELDRVLKPLIRSLRIDNPAALPVDETETYFVSEAGCICRQKETADGQVSIPLANFAAEIVEQTVYDDGAEKRTVFAIEGSLATGRPLPRIEVSAEEFPRMNWPVANWGTQAVVYAGMSTKDHLRAGMQILSGDVVRRFVYGHTGWRQIGDHWYYLHGGGAIGPAGFDGTVEVVLPDALLGYHLPNCPARLELVNAVRASVGLEGLGPASIVLPLLAGLYRAVLGSSDFGLHLAGPTGVFKSELAALVQQHFGPGLDARHFPGSWSSTGNALEATAFAAKDAILVVDDFAPNGTTSDVQRFHREADRLLRAQGNNLGRQRMRADGSLRAAKPPRGLILSTGEDVPRGQSLRARLLIIEISQDEIRQPELTKCQKFASEGLYAEAMAGFIQWLAPRYDAVRTGLQAEVAQLRDRVMGHGQHSRTPGIVADLAIGLKYLLAFAVDIGALTSDEAESFKRRAWDGLLAAAQAQAAHQEVSEPTRHFLRLLFATLASGRAHAASPIGECPSESPESWGWRGAYRGTGSDLQQTWTPLGHRIGWIDGDDLFLEPEAAFAEVQRLATEQGDGFAIASRTLHKRLREKGYLRSTDVTRKTLTIRRTLEGQRREVLHLHGASITSDQLTKLTNRAQDTADAEGFGQFAGQFPESGSQELTSGTDQNPRQDSPLVSLVSSPRGTNASTDLGFDSIPSGDGYMEGEL